MGTVPEVSIARGQDPYTVTRQSLSRLDPSSVARRHILIVPRTARPFSPQNSTHPAVVEAAIDWFRQNRAASIAVAECPPLGTCTERTFSESLTDLCRSKNVPLVNIDHHSVIWLDILQGTHLDRITTTGALVDHDFIVSMPTMRSDPSSGATLSLENLAGLVARHHKLLFESRILINGRGGTVLREKRLADLARILYPDMAIIDGMPDLESGGSLTDAGLVVAGCDALAVDEAACHLMGCNPAETVHLRLVARWRDGRSDSAVISPGRWKKWILPHRPLAGDKTSDQAAVEIINKKGCTSCQNAVYRFLEHHYTQLGSTENIRLAIGPEVPRCPAGTYYVGNCAVSRDVEQTGYHCNGCPPQERQIWEMVRKTHPAD
jgi:uncharacterized protein (DUF362 family)